LPSWLRARCAKMSRISPSDRARALDQLFEVAFLRRRQRDDRTARRRRCVRRRRVLDFVGLAAADEERDRDDRGVPEIWATGSRPADNGELLEFQKVFGIRPVRQCLGARARPAHLCAVARTM
jgi:hypothetical protein